MPPVALSASDALRMRFVKGLFLFTDAQVAEVKFRWSGELPKYGVLPKASCTGGEDPVDITDLESVKVKSLFTWAMVHSLSTGQIDLPLLFSVFLVLLQALIMFASVFSSFLDKVTTYQTVAPICHDPLADSFNFRWTSISWASESAAAIGSLVLFPLALVLTLIELDGFEEVAYQRLLLHSIGALRGSGQPGAWHPRRSLLVFWGCFIEFNLALVYPMLIYVTSCTAAWTATVDVDHLPSYSKLLVLGSVAGYLMNMDKNALKVLQYSVLRNQTAFDEIVLTKAASDLASRKPVQAGFVMGGFQVAIIVMLLFHVDWWQISFIPAIGFVLTAVYACYFIKFQREGWTRVVMLVMWFVFSGVIIGSLYPFFFEFEGQIGDWYKKKPLGTADSSCSR